MREREKRERGKKRENEEKINERHEIYSEERQKDGDGTKYR